jgi:LPXTG-site transpeptidase (sortase) family protein
MAYKKRKNVNTGKLTLGIALVALGLILMSGKFKPPAVSSDSFQSEPVKIEGFSENKTKEEDLPDKIIIPELSIDLQVRKSKLINGYWEVFSDSAGWGEGSGVPGKGNQVIFAHAREGLFKPMKNIKPNTKIYIFTKDKYYKYEVSEIKEVLPDQTEVIAPTADEVLTLYTCSGFTDSRRLIVRAKRI